MTVLGVIVAIFYGCQAHRDSVGQNIPAPLSQPPSTFTLQLLVQAWDGTPIVEGSIIPQFGGDYPQAPQEIHTGSVTFHNVPIRVRNTGALVVPIIDGYTDQSVTVSVSEDQALLKLPDTFTLTVRIYGDCKKQDVNTGVPITAGNLIRLRGGDIDDDRQAIRGDGKVIFHQVQTRKSVRLRVDVPGYIPDPIERPVPKSAEMDICIRREQSSPPPPRPTASISVNPNTIQSGESASLTWRTTNATDISIDRIGPVQANGSQTVSPPDSTSYHLTAKGAGGSIDRTALLTVASRTSPEIDTKEIPNPTLAIDGCNETEYGYTLKAKRGSGHYHFSVVEGSLPNGLTLDERTGLIHGRVHFPEDRKFTVQVRDDNGSTTTWPYSMNVLIPIFISQQETNTPASMLLGKAKQWECFRGKAQRYTLVLTEDCSAAALTCRAGTCGATPFTLDLARGESVLTSLQIKSYNLTEAPNDICYKLDAKRAEISRPYQKQ